MHSDQRPAMLDEPRAAAPFRLRRFAPVVLVILAAGAVFAMGWDRYLTLETLVRHRAALAELIDAHYPLAIASYIAIYIAVAGLSIPAGALLTMMGGILFGWRVGGCATVVGATVGATIIFLVARTACGEFLARRAGSFVAKIADGFLRLVPGFPFVVVNIVPGLVGVPLRTFVSATALGIIPGTFAYALAGAGLASALMAQEGPYKACLAAGRPDCRLDFTLSAAFTPELIAAIVALIVVALIPLVLRRWRPRGAA